MGDTNMITDNPIIVRNTRNEPTIVCVQKSAEKIVPTEEDIIKANKLAFNDDIGVVTNRITSMIEVRAGFDPDSEEYKTLQYRIKCGQMYQQNTIDRAKGIISKPMPQEWYSLRDCIVKEEDDEETRKRKEFNYRIAAYRKPYFMIYVYPDLKSDFTNYRKNNEKSAIRHFCMNGVRSLDDLAEKKDKTPEMESFYEYYSRQKPVGENNCVVNRIAKLFESEFNGALNKIAKQMNASDFDYSILKSGTTYSKSNYQKIEQIYREYQQKISHFQARKKTEKIDEFDSFLQMQTLTEWFKGECYQVCNNEEEMCDIVVDICYRNEKSKQFAWAVCGDVIIENLLQRNGRRISYPLVTDENGEFNYGGFPFIMREIKIEKEKIDDNFE